VLKSLICFGGDARAVLVRRNKPTRLSTIHTPPNEKERQRITKLGK